MLAVLYFAMLIVIGSPSFGADKIYPGSSQICTDESFIKENKIAHCKHAGSNSIRLFFENDADLASFQQKVDEARGNQNSVNKGGVNYAGEDDPEVSRTPTSSPSPQPRQQSTTDFSSDRRATDTQDLAKRYEEACLGAVKTAQKCCQHPEQCLGESVGADGSQNSSVLGALQAILSAAGQAASLSGACGKMQNVALTVTAINAALATKCTAKIVKCKQACSDVVAEARELYTKCKNDPESCVGYSKPVARNYSSVAEFDVANRNFNQEYTAARTDLAQMTKGIDSCEANENYAQQQVQQTVASALTAKTMGLCKEASSNSSSVSAANAAFNVDCSSSANAANPACQNVCNRAGSQNDPACNPNLAGSGYGTGSGTGTSGTNLNGLGSGIDELENAQGILTDSVNPNANKAQLGSGAGGGGVGGGGGGGLGGFESQAAGGGEAGSGFDPRTVGAGFRSGSGYSAPGGRGVASAGGAGGYSAPAGKPGTTAGQPFNPKDYLPGGRLDPKRKLAGLAATTPEIGAVHGDIFRSITNRFYQICLRDGLYDCATLRRSGTQGN